METDDIRDFDLASIGGDSSIGQESFLLGYCVENGSLILGRIGIDVEIPRAVAAVVFAR